MLSNLDQFLAKRIFSPPIIRYCQWTGASQYRAAKELDFAGWLVAIWMVRDAPGLVIGIGCVLAALKLAELAVWPDRRGDNQPWFRKVCFCLIPIDLALSALTGEAPYWPLLFWLAASYANDIDNVPPREKKNLTRARIALG